MWDHRDTLHTLFLHTLGAVFPTTLLLLHIYPTVYPSFLLSFTYWPPSYHPTLLSCAYCLLHILYLPIPSILPILYLTYFLLSYPLYFFLHILLMNPPYSSPAHTAPFPTLRQPTYAYAGHHRTLRHFCPAHTPCCKPLHPPLLHILPLIPSGNPLLHIWAAIIPSRTPHLHILPPLPFILWALLSWTYHSLSNSSNPFLHIVPPFISFALLSYTHWMLC